MAKQQQENSASGIDRMLDNLPVENEQAVTTPMSGSFVDAGIDLGRLQELREHHSHQATLNLAPEIFIARSLEFIPDDQRADARRFVADALLISDPAEQNEHLYKFRLKEYNSNATLSVGKWERFNTRANAIARRVRNAPRPESARHLTDEQYERRARDFIDGRHQRDALTISVPSRALETDPARKPLYLPIHYDESITPTGRFEPTAWEFFNRARNVGDAWIESGRPVDPILVLSINALMQKGELPGADKSTVSHPVFGQLPAPLQRYLETGEPPKGLGKVIRPASEPMGVFRSTPDLLRVIDENGRYRSDFFVDEKARPLMLGFCSRDVFVNEIVPLLRSINKDNPSPERYQELIEGVRARTERGPQPLAELQRRTLTQILYRRHNGDRDAMRADFQDPAKDPEYKRLQLLSSMDPVALRAHINAATTAYRDEICRLEESFGRSEALTAAAGQMEFARQAVRLAVEYGSVIDMGHFGMDGMGRTNLELERVIMGQLGLNRPTSISIQHNGVYYENGTYVPKNVRIDGISAKLDPLSAEDVSSRLTALSKMIREQDQHQQRVVLKE